MENKQTAVEWLINELANSGLLVTKDINNLVAYNKAKAMFEEQIKRAYNQGVVNEISIYSTISEEQYYNKTYGKNEIPISEWETGVDAQSGYWIEPITNKKWRWKSNEELK